MGYFLLLCVSLSSLRGACGSVTLAFAFRCSLQNWVFRDSVCHAGLHSFAHLFIQQMLGTSQALCGDPAMWLHTMHTLPGPSVLHVDSGLLDLSGEGQHLTFHM